MRLLQIIALAVLCSAELRAEDELVTDRPDQTESAVTIAPGKVQVEAGVTYAGDDGEERLSLPETLVRLGLSPRLELRLGWEGFERSFAEDDQETGGDGALGVKLKLWDEAGLRPEAAVLAGVSLPLGSDETTSNRLDPGFRLSLAHTLSERWSLGYNAGVEWATADDENGEADTLATGIYTCALGYGVSERVGIFAELFGEVPLNAEGGPAHSLDAGMTVLLRDNVQWDMAAGFGLNEAAEDWFVSTGLSVRFGDED